MNCVVGDGGGGGLAAGTKRILFQHPISRNAPRVRCEGVERDANGVHCTQLGHGGRSERPLAR